MRDLTEDSDDKAIISTIIGLAGSLGMKTIAEGVETAQATHLRQQGCNEGARVLLQQAPAGGAVSALSSSRRMRATRARYLNAGVLTLVRGTLRGPRRAGAATVGRDGVSSDWLRRALLRDRSPGSAT